jgi:hypothetical protein
MSARRQMTLVQWCLIHRDFKTIIDGTRCVLSLNPATGGTELVPVEITDCDFAGEPRWSSFQGRRRY